VIGAAIVAAVFYDKVKNRNGSLSRN